eukprot:2364241-Rhodomonas_salina.2
MARVLELKMYSCLNFLSMKRRRAMKTCALKTGVARARSRARARQRQPAFMMQTQAGRYVLARVRSNIALWWPRARCGYIPGLILRLHSRGYLFNNVPPRL